MHHLTDSGGSKNDSMRAARTVQNCRRHRAVGSRIGGWVAPLLLLWVAPWSAAQGLPSDPPPQAPGLGLLEAVRLALVNDPELRLAATQVTSSRGSLISAGGAFDPLLTSRLTADDFRTPQADGSTATSESLETTVAWSQLLRSGQSLEPNLSIERRPEDSGTLNTATLSFTVRQPLLRGRRGEAVRAFESAAEYQLEASRLDWLHITSQRLLAVVSQYWTVKASWLDLEILRSTEASSRDLLVTTRRLIEAQLTPAAELVQLEADLVLREANRVVGERNLFQALQRLGNELGLDADGIAVLAMPTDPFPTVEAEQVPVEVAPYLRQAALRRADLLAGQQRLLADEQLLVAADDALEPRLDLVWTPSYSGLVDGASGDDYLSSLWTQIPGLSTTFGIELSLPLRRRVAAGALLQAQAAVAARGLSLERDSKGIDSRVPSAFEEVRRNAERLERLEQAVELFERTLENENKKLRAGTSTLIDVISQRDRLTSALQSRNAAQLAVAIALAELRFETGTLIAADVDTLETDSYRISYDDFTTLPPRRSAP